MIAMTLTGIVMTLAFTSYSSVTRGFSHRTAQAEKLRKVLLVKKKIDRFISSIELVERCSSSQVRAICFGTDTSVTVTYSGRRVVSGNTVISDGLTAFSFTLVTDTKNRENQDAVLLWEGMVDAVSWVGGAAAVKRVP